MRLVLVTAFFGITLQCAAEAAEQPEPWAGRAQRHLLQTTGSGGNLVQNGGFETGMFAPNWVQSDNTGATGVDGRRPNTGNFAAFLGPVGSTGAISQTFTTIRGTCVLGFFLSATGDTDASSIYLFQAYVDNVLLTDQTVTSSASYRQVTVTFGGSGAPQTLKFVFRNDPRYYLLDDVSVTCAAASPSPTPSGSTTGDPLVKGFDGCSWYMMGRPGQVLNLLTESQHSVNTQLVAANLADEDHPEDGTFHGAISVRYRHTLAVVSVTASGNLTVKLGDALVPFEEIRYKSGMRVKVSQYLPYYGQAAEIITPSFRFFVHAVQPYDTPAGWSRGHLDFTASIVASDMRLHGLLGQSLSHRGASCSEDWKFHGDGTEEDYVVGDLEAVDFQYALFGRQMSTTRRLQGARAASASVDSPILAFSRGFYGLYD